MGNDYDVVSDSSLSLTVKQIVKMPIAMVEKIIDDIAHLKGDEFVKDILRHLPQ